MPTASVSSSTAEREQADAVAAILSAVIDRDYPPGTLARRDAHPKHHGLLRASFVVSDEIAPDLRHGVFAAPGRFDAWIRLSNGAPHVGPDSRRDQRGFAVKLVGVPGAKLLEAERDATTQDFLLSSAPRFFLRDASDYLAFTQAAARRPAIRLLGFFVGWNPRRWRIYELRALASSLTQTTDLLSLRYYSQVPSRLGPHVVKYGVRPLHASGPTPPSTGPDFLRDALVAHLAERPARFEFLVQRYRSDAATPIEDATVEWTDTVAPFERVATIDIPPQQFDTPAQMALAEQLSFTPWHSLPEHEPLGAVNRMRRIVYAAISEHRHRRNGVRRVEPTSLALDS